MNPEAILRDATQAANDGFTAVAMRDGVTRGEVEDARRVRDAAITQAHDAYRNRFRETQA